MMSNQMQCMYIVHCAAHNLNLVINYTVSSVSEAVKFFTILQDLQVFLTKYSQMGYAEYHKLTDMLNDLTGEFTVTLKELNPTCWSGRLLTVTILGMKPTYYIMIFKLLTLINLQSSKREEIAEAEAEKKH